MTLQKVPLREITEQEWSEYEWICLEGYDGKPVYLRGVKRTYPPEDGYHYVESTTARDTERKWSRALTFDE